jgi:hypothetical protein
MSVPRLDDEQRETLDVSGGADRRRRPVDPDSIADRKIRIV